MAETPPSQEFLEFPDIWGKYISPPNFPQNFWGIWLVSHGAHLVPYITKGAEDFQSTKAQQCIFFFYNFSYSGPFEKFEASMEAEKNLAGA